MTGSNALVERLTAREEEIREEIFRRISKLVPVPPDLTDAEYFTGLGAAVRAAIECSLAAIAAGEYWSVPIPPALASQARLAARSGVALDTVLRRYSVGNTVLGDFIMEETEDLPRDMMCRALQTIGSLLHRLQDEMTQAHKAEQEQLTSSSEQELAARVKELLEGKRVALDSIPYRFDGWHLGIIAHGQNALKGLRRFQAAFGRELLTLPRGDNTAWGWLGGQRPLAYADLKKLLPSKDDTEVRFAVGSPGLRLDGFRLTHEQAQAASVVALRGSARLTEYAAVMLDATAMLVSTLGVSLRQTFLTPLDSQRDGGVASRETLREYYDTGRNVATTAVRLKCDRHTVERRIDRIQELIGRDLHTCHAAMETALRLEALCDDAALRHPRTSSPNRSRFEKWDKLSQYRPS